MSKALLDTDIFSEVLRGRNATVVQHATTYRQTFGRLTLSVISLMEMVKGLQQAGRPQQIPSLLARLNNEDVLPFDQPTAELAGRI